MSTFKYALTACGLSINEAAEFLGVNVSTIKHWSANRRPAPDFAWKMLSDLYQRIQSASDVALDYMDDNGVSDQMLQSVQADDTEDPLPDGPASLAGAIAYLEFISD